MRADMQMQFPNLLSDAQTEAMTRSLVDLERVTNHLGRDVYGITSNEQMQFKKEVSLHWIELEAWW
jgi:hypothetical protein